MSIQYQEHDLDEVIKYFVDGFGKHSKTRDGKFVKILKHESFLDAKQNKVVLKLFVEDIFVKELRKAAV